MKVDRPSKNLIDDVAQDGVADDHVGHVVVRSLPSTLPVKLRSGLVEQLRGALDAGVALALLLADREQRHPRVRDAEHALREDARPSGVLDEVLRRSSPDWRRCRAGRTARWR